jgi:RNA polymerase sigma factor (sigma-70 family)
MYREGTPPRGMEPDELERARLGFNQYLRRKGFSRQFIDRYGDELFATAALEYSRKLTEGEEIEDPAAWLVTCAWQRTKDQLRVEARRPAAVSADEYEPVVDEAGQSPEDILLEEDRFRQVRDAVNELPIRQRRILALSYFEGLTVREAARQLHWHSSKAQRAHEGARRRLHELLGVSSADDLEVEIGLATYLSVAAGSNGNLLERAAQRSAETLASFKQQISEAGAQLKQHASTTYYRAVDPTPLAAARPGTVAAVLASCVAIGGSAATYCVERGVNPLSQAQGLIASADEAEAPPPKEPEPSDSAPVYTPVEPLPESTELPDPEPEPPPAEEEAPRPKVEKPSPGDPIEPVHTPYMEEEETESAEGTEAPEESVSTESRQPKAVAANAGSQFGGP